MNELLHSVRKLFNKFMFVIPAYQRGYKWESKDIKQLLEDIDSFSMDDNLDLFYCLQNITLIKDPNGKYQVVDGQQRLTTMIIILAFLGEKELIKNRIDYAVREETKLFISEFIYGDKSLDYDSWDDFLDENKAYNFQDVFYMFTAYKTTQEWLKDNNYLDKEGITIKNKILENVKMIVNIQDNIQAQELFENLNGKRVPLDGADLVRALIITRIAKAETIEIENNLKRDILLEERRMRLGLVLDNINIWWNNKDRKEYFNNFTREVKADYESTIHFDEHINPINMLYKMYCLINEKKIISLYEFEEWLRNGNDVFLKELLKLQRLIEDWYEDSELYHLVLYSFIYQKITFKVLYDTWESRSTRQNFINYLKQKIMDDEIITGIIDEKSDDNSADWYNDKLIKVVVLLDIISLLKSPLKPKLPPKYFVCYNEDKEHIFPQTPVSSKNLTETLSVYVSMVNEYTLNEEEKICIDDIKEVTKDESELQHLINNKVKNIIPIGALGNMCLLDKTVNRGYGNDFFSFKRIDIMRKAQTNIYIRPHVYDAFNKSFLDRNMEIQQIKESMYRWDVNDIKKRTSEIKTQIKTFLKSTNNE